MSFLNRLLHAVLPVRIAERFPHIQRTAPAMTLVNPSSIGGGLALIWFVYFIVKTFVNYLRLRHIKGPWLASISPLWLFYHTARGKLYLANQEVLEKYGSPARISTDMIITDDPNFYRMMCAPRSPFIRGRWFKGMRLGAGQDNVLSMTDEKMHADLRTKLMPGYTGKEVPTLEADVDARITELFDLIRRDFIEKDEPLDFARLAGYFTLDVLTKIAFGKAIGFLTENKDLYNYHKTSSEFYPIMELGSNHPAVLGILNSKIMQFLAGPKAGDRVGLGAIIGVAHAAVAERFKPGAKLGDDMISSFARHNMTREECETECMLQILAGSDSTSTALRTTFLYILTSPPSYTKLMEEIKAAVESGRITSPVVKFSETQTLPYLQASIKEGLRMFMPLHGLAGRVSPAPDGATVNGVYIPPGTDVGAAVYSMLRRKDLFGPDADTFRPERWLENDPETVKTYERLQEMVFGYGRSSCLGKSIALMELHKVIFELLRTYDFTLVDPFNAMKIRSNSVVVQEDMILRAWPRSAK